MSVCVGDPPACCQAPLSVDQQARMLDRFDSIARTYREETPSRCGWCGGGWVAPVFVTDRRSWICVDCRREFTPGAIG